MCCVRLSMSHAAKLRQCAGPVGISWHLAAHGGIRMCKRRDAGLCVPLHGFTKQERGSRLAQILIDDAHLHGRKVFVARAVARFFQRPNEGGVAPYPPHEMHRGRARCVAGEIEHGELVLGDEVAVGRCAGGGHEEKKVFALPPLQSGVGRLHIMFNIYVQR